MSKFIENLRNKTKLVVPPIGFRSVVARPKPVISVVAEIPQMKILPDGISDADAVLSGNMELPSSGSDANVPVGVRLKEKTAINLSWQPLILLFLGWMRTLFELSSDVGKIIEIDSSLSDMTLRGLDDLGVDALLVADRPKELSWRFLTQLQRIDNLFSKFILVAVPLAVNINEIQLLWQAGADGVLIDVGSNLAGLKELRGIIEKSEFKLPRKVRKPEAAIPTIPSAPAAARKEEEEEEEEDE